MCRVTASKASTLAKKKSTLQPAALKHMLSYFPASVQKNRANEQSVVKKTNNVELTKKQNTKTLPANPANKYKLCENQVDE